MNTDEQQKTNATGQEAVHEVSKVDHRRFAQRIVDAAKAILEDIEFGKEYTADYLAGLIQSPPGTQKFGLGVSEVNKLLGRSGYVLTSRGFNGTRWKILELKRTNNFVRTKCAQHIRGLYECAVLARSAVTNHGDKLTTDERRRLEKTTEIMALRYLMCKRVR